MRGGRLTALALVASVAAAGGQAALAQEDERSNQTTTRMWVESGYYGTFTVRATRRSGSTAEVRAGATLQRPEILNGVVRIRCLTQEGEYVCLRDVPLTIRAGERTRRRCTVRILRERQRRRRVRRCRNVRVPIESAIRATVDAVHADGSPARVYEVIVYYVADNGAIVSSSGRLGVPD